MGLGIVTDPRAFSTCPTGARCLVCPGLKSNGFMLAKNIQTHADSSKHKLNLLRISGQSAPRQVDVSNTAPIHSDQPDSSSNSNCGDTFAHLLATEDSQPSALFEPDFLQAAVAQEATNNDIHRLEGGDYAVANTGDGNENDDKEDGSWCGSNEDGESNYGCNGFSGEEEEEGEEDGSEDERDTSEDGWNSDIVLDTHPTIRQGSKRVRVEPQVGDAFYPYASKGFLMADMAFNAPRARYSHVQQNGSLEMLRELAGKSKAPSAYALGEAQKKLETMIGNPTHRETTGAGTVWYRNKISDSLAKDMSNPITRCDMEFYPHLEHNGQHLTQVWHGAKMLYGVPDHQLTPMIRTSNNKIYYVNELVKLNDGRFFIPRRWFLKGNLKAQWSFGDFVIETPAGFVIKRTSLVLRPSVAVDCFTDACTTLLASYELFAGFAPGFEADLELMPHPLRRVAGERDVLSVPLILFLDDVSGGISKQWNKNIACYMSNATLPREKLQKEVNVHFVGSSKNATASEMLLRISASIKKEFMQPTITFDALAKREVLIRPYALMWPGDNPMQAEACSCGSLSSNFMCRTCGAGGTQEFKRSVEGYSSLFEEGVIRDPQKTLDIVNARMEMALQANVRTKVDNHGAQTGVKDGIAQTVVDQLIDLGIKLRTAVPGKPAMHPDKVQEILSKHLASAKEQGAVNALLEMDGVDIHQDTPTEILHTVLLGVVKYFWAQTMHIVKQHHQMELFRTRLCSVDSAGLGIPPIPADYMCDYAGSLIGKHFKAIAQVMPFVVYDLVPENVRNAWLLIGRLVVLLWNIEISSLDTYLVELRDVIDKFLLTTAMCSPSILMLKPKFHFLVHLPRFIARFGPAILYSTERYECYHAVFRATMIKSNRQAPSRDAAKAIASIARVQHICQGGYWRNPDGSGWVQAGPDVLAFVARRPVFSKLLGIYVKVPAKPGTVTSVARSKEKLAAGAQACKPLSTPWVDTVTAKLGLMPIEPGGYQTTTRYEPLKAVIALSGDRIVPGTHAIIKIGESTEFCTIVELLLRRPNDALDALLVFFATVQPMQLSATKQEVLDIPQLTLMPSIRLVEFVDIVCAVNLQHNCISAGCNETILMSIVQEREVTSCQHTRVKHVDTKRFLVNTQALHNNKHILAALPLALRDFAYTIGDRVACLTTASLALCATHDIKTAKRKALADKAKEDKATEATKAAAALVASQHIATEDDLQVPGPADRNRASPPVASGSGSVQVPAFVSAAPAPAIPELPQLKHCVVPVLKAICRKFNMVVGSTTRKGDIIKRLETHFVKSGQVPPTEEEIQVLRDGLNINNKRTNDNLEPNGEDTAGPSRKVLRLGDE